MDCPICFNVINDIEKNITPCQHVFCNTCIIEWKKNNVSCPLCRTQIQPLDYIPPYDTVYIRDLERIAHIGLVDRHKASMLYIEYMKWLNGTRFSRPVIF